MSKTHFRTRLPGTPGYPTREELLDHRRLLAVGLGAMLATGPLAGCQVRPAAASSADAARSGLETTRDAGAPVPDVAEDLGGSPPVARDSDTDAGIQPRPPMPLGGVPPPPRDPVPPKQEAPVVDPEDLQVRQGKPRSP